MAFQDSDDLWCRDKLERQVAEMESLPASRAMVYSPMLMRKPEGGVLFGVRIFLVRREFVYFRDRLDGDGMCGCCRL